MQFAKKVYFTFPDIPATGNFSFEKFSLQNFQQLYLLFESDDSPFTDTKFKSYAGAETYATHQEMYGTSTPKHGSQDWFFLWKNKYAGILHLYDLSLETFAENNQRCWIGFATHPAYKRQGITKKVLGYFLQYIFQNYPVINFIHVMTLKENLPAQRLIHSVGFIADNEERMSKAHYFYLLSRNNQA